MKEFDISNPEGRKRFVEHYFCSAISRAVDFKDGVDKGSRKTPEELEIFKKFVEDVFEKMEKNNCEIS